MKFRRIDGVGAMFLFTTACATEAPLGQAKTSNDGSGGASNSANGGAQSENGGASGAGLGGTSSGGAVGSETGGATSASSLSSCEGACCPAEASCYSTPAGNGSPGSECLATRDNTLTPKRIQMRQMWLNTVSPAGLQQSIIYQTLNTFTTLPLPNCGLDGNSGYIQLLDFDLDAGTARVGYATFLPSSTAGANAVTNGFCMAKTAAPWESVATFSDSTTQDLGIPQAQLYDPTTTAVFGGKYPVGLPRPMGEGWNAAPAFAKRMDVDFDLSQTAAPIAALAATPSTDLTPYQSQREELLERLDPVTGDLGKEGFTSVFFFDNTTKHVHAYSPVAWQILYDKGTATDYELIPLREAEMQSAFNDPAHPNCVGAYNGATLAANTPPCAPGGTSTNTPSKANNAWGEANGTNDGKAPGSTSGYFLIVELEQIWSHVLSQSLCSLYPTGPVSLANGYGTADKQLCRNVTGTTKWDPKDPVNGIPKGDWCSYDNTPAHDNCHDAYRTVTYQAFAASNVQDGTCDAATANGG